MRVHLAACLAFALVGCETTAPPDIDPQAPAQPAPSHQAMPDELTPIPDAPTPSADEAAPIPDGPLGELPTIPNEPLPIGDDPGAAHEAHRVDLTEGEEANLRPTPEVVEPGRPWRRMNVDQLDAAMQRASGGISWVEVRGAYVAPLFTELSATLGKPDYVEITQETLEPTPLFLKFLDDAARSVCGEMIRVDLAAPEEARILLSDDVDQRLTSLLLRFHSRRVGPDDPGFETWRWLHRSTAFVTDEATAPWYAVCVALFTHPDFYSY
jgi:hypothetical protein